MTVNTPRKMGEAHKRSILMLLFEHETLSRAELSRLLKLSPPAVTANINVLLEAGMIRQIGAGTSDYGRKPILISLNNEFRYVIGVDIGEKQICVALSDFTKHIVDVLYTPSMTEKGAGMVIEQVIASIRAILVRNDKNIELGSIAVSAPGIINRVSGAVEFSTVVPDFKDYDLSGMLQEVFSVPVYIENDVDMAVCGEYQEGNHGDSEDLVYIKVGDGAAARIVSNGRLLHGRGNIAGEIGYMLLDRKHVRDSFHVRGVLEQEICNRTVDSIYRDKTGIGHEMQEEYYSIEKMIALSEKGDVSAHEILQKILDDLSRVIVNLTAILDTGVIILGGDLEKLRAEHINEITEFVGRYVPYTPKIRISRFGQMAGIKGCITHAINEMLKEMGMFV